MKEPTTKPTHVWLYDTNRRIYPEGGGSPIWRKHWRRFEIVGETARSWLLDKPAPLGPVLQRGEDPQAASAPPAPADGLLRG
jgi:hypothetical protein